MPIQPRLSVSFDSLYVSNIELDMTLYQSHSGIERASLAFNACSFPEAPPFPPHPGLAHELQESIERGDAASIGKRTLESCAYLAQTMLSQSVASFQVK